MGSKVAVSIHTRFITVLVLLIAVSLASCADSRVEELQFAYEQYMSTLTQAQINLDSQQLSDVAVSPRLDEAIASVEDRKKFTAITSEEFKIDAVKLISYTAGEAVAEITLSYRDFVQDPVTGQREYSALTDRWYWRIERVTFVKEDSVWKVKGNTFVDWGG